MSRNKNKDSICKEIISSEDVSSICGKLFPSKKVKILNYQLEPFSDEPFGYLSVHNLLSVKLLDPDESRSFALTFFVKSMLPSPTRCEKLFFEEESKFFRDVVPQLLENYKSQPWSAECFLAKENVIVMEDLRVEGFQMPSAHLSVDQLMMAAAGLARFHASSILLEDKLGKPLNELYPGHFEEKLLNAKGADGQWLIAGMETIEAVAKTLSLETHYCWLAFQESLFKVLHDPSRRNVLSHGDTWRNNLMLRDETRSCRLVDFQMVAYRYYAIDLAQLIYLDESADYEKRIMMEMYLSQVYCQEMNRCLESHDYGGPLMDSVQMFKDLKEIRVVGLILAALIFPIALLSGKLKEEYTKDPVQMRMYMYVDRKHFVLRAFEENHEYRDKIVGIVKDLVEFMKKKIEDEQQAEVEGEEEDEFESEEEDEFEGEEEDEFEGEEEDEFEGKEEDEFEGEEEDDY